MRHNVSDMLGECYRRLNYSTQPPSIVTTRLLAFINDAETELLSLTGMAEKLLQSSLTATSTAAQAVIALPPSVARLISLRDTSNQWRLIPMPSDAYYSTVPDPDVEFGTPDRYAVLGLRAVALDPSAPSVLYLVSTSALDVQTAFFTVISTGGQVSSGSVVLTGTTAVFLPDLSSVIQCVDLYLNSGAVGTITLREGSGVGDVLSTIYPNTLASAYQRVALAPTPSEGITYTLDYEREQSRMTNGTDSSVLPDRFQRLLPLGALMRESVDKGDAKRFSLLQQDWARGVGLLNAYFVNAPDVVVVPGGVPTDHSVLGPWTPASGYGDR